MDASRARPPAPTALCPGCGEPIDPLRAAQVAILSGGFRYFCSAACKERYVDGASKRATLDAMTADPPAVVVSSQVRSRADDDPLRGRGDGDAEADEGREPDAGSDVDAAHGVDTRDEAVARDRAGDDAAGAPETLRSPEGEGAEIGGAPAARADLLRLRARLAEAAPLVGIGAGVLAAAVTLAGEGAGIVRLPLALVAVAILVARAALGPHDAAGVSPWVVVASVVPAALAAVASRGAADPRADAHAAFVGLAAAGALLAEILVARARRDVEARRARIAVMLDVGARVVRAGPASARGGAGPDTGAEAVEDVDAARVKPGEQVVVHAGDTIPVDGIVSAGAAEIAPWLESTVLMEKREGDAVVAGAAVVSGRLRVNATFTGAERAWLRLASAAPSRIDVAAPIVALARRSVERGAPVAALVVAGATYANNAGLADVVVAACAGAYAVAASSAIAASGLAHARAHAAAQRRGIVYKDAVAFDSAGRADVAVVCSRGTVLLGEPEIVAVEAVGARASAEDKAEIARVLSLAAGAEMGSTHPFAAAVHRAARARGVPHEHVRSALKHSGLGVTALAPNGDKVIVGSRAFLLSERVSVAIADARVSALEAQGRSVLLVAIGGRLAGLLALQDGLRPGARAAVQRLHDAHVEPVLLSGEARDTCETIARALDIEHVRPEILPADRGAEVRALADGGHVVAALGHASSDDGALGAADVSVAMGAAGAAPGEWSVALASDDVRDAALVLTVPRACRERAKTVVLVGAGAQALSALGIAFGLAPPVLAPVLAVAAAASALAIVREPTKP